MSKLRRVSEVGDGSYEQMLQKNTQVHEDPIDAANRRKKKFTSVAAKQPQPPENNWESLKGALKVAQKPFDPQSYSSYDTSGRSVRRYESDDDEYDDSYDTRLSAPMSLHMYSDTMMDVKESLSASALRDAMQKESQISHEIRQLEQAQQWDSEASAWARARLKGRNNENISSSDMKGGIMKTANENVVASNFGQTDYNAVDDRDLKKHQMIEAMNQKHRSIKDSRIDITKEQKQSQWANDDNVRSQSVHNKTMQNSKLFNKLSQLMDE